MGKNKKSKTQDEQDSSLPINLKQHEKDLDEEEELDERSRLLQEELTYNISAEPGNISLTSTELYGFVSWVFSGIAIIAFTLWAFVPHEWFYEQGIYYLIPRHYLLSVTNWVAVTFLYVHLVSWLVCTIKSHENDSYFTIVDRHSKLQPYEVPPPAKVTASGQRRTKIPDIIDLSITVVNNVLYQKYMDQPTDLIDSESD